MSDLALQTISDSLLRVQWTRYVNRKKSYFHYLLNSYNVTVCALTMAVYDYCL